MYSSNCCSPFQERNSRKGRFCPSKLKGKRVIELGAGCGVAGFGMFHLLSRCLLQYMLEAIAFLSHVTSEWVHLNALFGKF